MYNATFVSVTKKLSTRKGALTLELICLSAYTWRVSKMDFPSSSSKLATRHANKGDVPPAASHENDSCITAWQC